MYIAPRVPLHTAHGYNSVLSFCPHARDTKHIVNTNINDDAELDVNAVITDLKNVLTGPAQYIISLALTESDIGAIFVGCRL